MKKIQLIFIIVIISSSSFIISQNIKYPVQNPLEGRIVFEEKGCIYCHAINGYGENKAPDLAKNKYYGSFLDIASTIWNHIPKMNRKFRKLKIERPRFSDKEMLDLIYFIYYLRYLGEPGSVANGKKLLDNKGCINCHKVGGKGGDIGPEFSKLGKYSSPLLLAQAMWNHVPAMQKKMKELKIPYPTLTGKEMNDISIYIKLASYNTTKVRLSPGSPLKGEKVFKEKRCGNCHQLSGDNENIAPNLSDLDLNKSVTEVAAMMWNHSSDMLENIKEKKLIYPNFKDNEMADLIAYLYFLKFEDKPGNAEKGLKVFEEKGCASCHETGNGPDLKKLKPFKSRIQILQRMWNHATKMEDLLVIQNDEWPKLTLDEMRDLYEYLRSILIKRDF